MEFIAGPSETIPRTVGHAFEVAAGQGFRVTAIAGKQVGDMTLLGRHDTREQFSVPMTTGLGSRSMRSAVDLFSGPPYGNIMASRTNDSVGHHYLGGRCSKWWYKTHMGLDEHRNCHDNIVEALAPFDVELERLSLDTFNIFMSVTFSPEGDYSFQEPQIETGDSVDFVAQMDLIVAISACPGPNEINGYDPKPLGIQMLTRT